MDNLTHQSTTAEFHSERNGTIDPLSVFTFMFAIAVLFHFMISPVRPSGQIADLVGVACEISCLLLLFNPRSILLLIFMSTTLVAEYAFDMPVASNHYIMDMVMALAVVLSAAFFLRDKHLSSHRAEFYNAFAPAGRFFLVIMYFFGIFHKINPDFLNPDVSCAVVLMNGITTPLGLNHIEWIKHAAIWGTFVAEGIAMLALFSRRWKYWGFAIGLPFHMIIAFTGYRFYIEYSSLAIALYCLFLPREFYLSTNEAVDNIRNKYGLSRRNFWKSMRIVLVACLTVIMVFSLYAYLAAGGVGTRESYVEYTYRMMPLFPFYCIPVYFCFLYFSRNIDPSVKEPMYAFTKPLLVILPLLFFLNGFGPYFGWKTESAISMFSQLHTEGSKTNHLILTNPPQLFDYQKDVVKIISSSNSRLKSYAKRDLQLVHFELRRILTKNPTATVVYEMNGQRYEYNGVNNGQFEPVSAIAQKVLLFKPVDMNWPKVCSH